MSTHGNCPVCDEPKERRSHIVCPYCWTRVPDDDQREIVTLYVEKRGSLELRLKGRRVVKALIDARKAVAA